MHSWFEFEKRADRRAVTFLLSPRERAYIVIQNHK
jgi:hypothetical protein